MVPGQDVTLEREAADQYHVESLTLVPKRVNRTGHWFPEGQQRTEQEVPVAPTWSTEVIGMFLEELAGCQASCANVARMSATRVLGCSMAKK